MNSNRRDFVTGLTATVGAGALGWLPAGGLAQTAWPSKPVRVIVGFPAGGLTDALARAYCDFLSQKLGQPFLVDNKPGVSGMIAGAEVAKSAPDGYTFLFTITGSLNQNRVLYKKMPYDPDKDFAYVSGFHAGHLPLAVNAASPIKTMKDLVELGKKQRITIGNYSPGSWPHMVAQQLAKNYGIQVEPIPYRGEAPMWIDLASGQITAAAGSYLALSPHLQSGKIRPIAVPTRMRSVLLPDVPTFDEQGFKDDVFTIEGWIGMLAPMGTPRDVVQRISALCQDAADTPRIKAINKNFGLNDKPWTAEQFEKLDRDNRSAWVGLAKELNLSLD